VAAVCPAQFVPILQRGIVALQRAAVLEMLCGVEHRETLSEKRFTDCLRRRDFAGARTAVFAIEREARMDEGRHLKGEPTKDQARKMIANDPSISRTAAARRIAAARPIGTSGGLADKTLARTLKPLFLK